MTFLACLVLALPVVWLVRRSLVWRARRIARDIRQRQDGEARDRRTREAVDMLRELREALASQDFAHWRKGDRDAWVARIDALKLGAKDVFQCRYCGSRVDFLKPYHSDARGLWHWTCGEGGGSEGP